MDNELETRVWREIELLRVQDLPTGGFCNPYTTQ